jgi:hypothetical protein
VESGREGQVTGDTQNLPGGGAVATTDATGLDSAEIAGLYMRRIVASGPILKTV